MTASIYDHRAPVRTTTDPLNRTTLIERDPQGNPTQITRPNGAITTMTYDPKGNLLTSTEQAIAAATTFTYEPTFNQVTRITDPRKGVRSYNHTFYPGILPCHGPPVTHRISRCRLSCHESRQCPAGHRGR